MIQNLLTILLPITFGWVLGLLSTPIVWAISNFFKKKNIKNALIKELSELQFRLLGAVFLINTRSNLYDRKIFKWMLPLVKNYTGNYPKASLIEGLEKFISASDEKISELQEYKGENIRGLAVKKYFCPFLESQTSNLSLYNAEFQQNMAELKAQLHIINETVDDVRYYHRLTFDSSLSDTNYNLAVKNCEDRYLDISKKAQQIAILIEKLR